MRTRSMPCTSTVVLPSGMRNTRPISTAVPTVYRSETSGSTELRVALRDDQQRRSHRLGRFNRAHRTITAHEQRRDQVGEDDRIATGNTGYSLPSSAPSIAAAPAARTGAAASGGCGPSDSTPRSRDRVPETLQDREVDKYPPRTTAPSRARFPAPASSSDTIAASVSSWNTQSSGAKRSGCRAAQTRRACATTKIEPVTQIRSSGPAHASASASAAAMSPCTSTCSSGGWCAPAPAARLSPPHADDRCA